MVEDHVLQRERTEELITKEASARVVCRFETFPQFLDWLKVAPSASHPQLLILDLVVERGPSVDPAAVRRLVDSGLKVLVLSAMASPSLVRAVLQAGVAGIVGKRDSAQDLVDAVRTVCSGEQWITPEVASVIASDETRPDLSDQEERALVLYAAGLTLSAVAERIGVKPDTAKKYIARVRRKYAAVGRPASSKTDLYRAAVADGLVSPVRHALRRRRARDSPDE